MEFDLYQWKGGMNMVFDYSTNCEQNAVEYLFGFCIVNFEVLHHY